jgi:hypothetical protein
MVFSYTQVFHTRSRKLSFLSAILYQSYNESKYEKHTVGGAAGAAGYGLLTQASCVEGLCGGRFRGFRRGGLPLRGNKFLMPPVGGEVLAPLTFPPDTVILSRRRKILVSGTLKTTGNKYQSVGNPSGVCRK